MNAMFTPTLNFRLNTSKINKEGLAPVYLRVTINGIRSEISTKVYVDPAKWDDRKSQIKGKEPVDIRKNKILFDFTTQIYEALDALKKRRFDITAANIKLALMGELFKKTTVIEVYRQYMDYLQVRIGSDFSPSSYEIHKTTFDQVQEFLQHEKKEHIAIDEFSNPNFHRFEVYLKKYKENQHNTVYKKIERFRSMFKWAFEMEIIDKDISRRFKIKKQKKEIIFLTWEELEAIKAIDTSIERLAVIRDIFVFMCYTGFAFKEIESLKLEHLSRNIKGGYGLIMTRQKTQKNIPEIPLLPEALDLINKYQNHPKRIREKKLFPVPANQNFNAYLKEIADLAKVEKNITTHTARKTFATTIALRNGMSMEVLSKLLGHSSIRITQESYAEMQQDRIKDEFDRLKLRLEEGIRNSQNMTANQH